MENISENPYLQYFLGLHEFQTKPLFDTSMMTYFRKRFTADDVAAINEELYRRVHPPKDEPPQGGGNGGTLVLDATVAPADVRYCALPGFVDSKNEEKTERNAGYLVVSHSGGGMLRQGTRKGIRRTPANRGMRAHRIVKSLDISEDVCHGLCP